MSKNERGFGVEHRIYCLKRALCTKTDQVQSNKVSFVKLQFSHRGFFNLEFIFLSSINQGQRYLYVLSTSDGFNCSAMDVPSLSVILKPFIIHNLIKLDVCKHSVVLAAAAKITNIWEYNVDHFVTDLLRRTRSRSSKISIKKRSDHPQISPDETDN